MTKIASITVTSKRHKIIGEALGYPEEKIQESLSAVEEIKARRKHESEVDIQS